MNVHKIDALYFSIPGLRRSADENVATVGGFVGANGSHHKKVINQVCSYFAITHKDLLSQSRKANLVMPRSICFYLLSKVFSYPLIYTGNLFNRDHTTVIHAREKIAGFLSLETGCSKEKKVIDDFLTMYGYDVNETGKIITREKIIPPAPVVVKKKPAKVIIKADYSNEGYLSTLAKYNAL